MNIHSYCKPWSVDQELFLFLKAQPGFFFSKKFPSLAYPLSLRTLDLAGDLPLIHNWVNQPYAKEFWQLAVNPPELLSIYRTLLEQGHTHSIVACYNDEPVAQIDLYQARLDEVGKHFNATNCDYGVHFLMAPLFKPIPLFSTLIFSAVLEFLFQFSSVQRVVGEPDSLNEKANMIVLRIGFRFEKRITLPDKEANLYFCERSPFIPFH